MKNSEPIFVAKSNGRGLGVFAGCDIKKSEKICKMFGQKISADELYKISESGRDIVVDGLQVGEREYINLEKPYVLINHSCNPNAGIRGGGFDRNL